MVSKLPTVLSFLFLLVFITSSIATPSPKCKCLPHHPCWPGASVWSAFSTSLSHPLIPVHPLAAPCYPSHPSFDSAVCKTVTENFTSSVFRSDQPSSFHHINWETSAFFRESCPLPSLLPDNKHAVCRQGNVAEYAVKVATAEDVVRTLKFVKKHNLPVAIKNTGHDFLGRAARRGSVTIWTHWMKNIEFLNESGGWAPSGCRGKDRQKYQELEMLVRVGAGVQLAEMYREVGKKDRTVVGGYANTVGIAGGYLQGGGHSPLGVWKGMSTDHVVEYDVVTADGIPRTVNECSDPDLFWALRGGGGSTFAVVMSATLRTHANPPLVLFAYNFTVPPSDTEGNTSYWSLIERFHALIPSINDAGGSGYYWLFNNLPGGANMFASALFFVGHSDTAAVEKLFSPLESLVNQTVPPIPGLVQRDVAVLPKTSFLFDVTLSGDDNRGATNTVLGSRLLSRKLLLSTKGVSQTVGALKRVSALAGGTNVITGHLVAGRGVARNKRLDTALNPRWREALNHVVVATGWEEGASWEEQDRSKQLLTRMVEQLDRVEGDMGAYANEGNKEEKEWQRVYWGDNYKRLRKIKKRWDPEEVFWCRPCVGSEAWDSEGICPVNGGKW